MPTNQCKITKAIRDGTKEATVINYLSSLWRWAVNEYWRGACGKQGLLLTHAIK